MRATNVAVRRRQFSGGGVEAFSLLRFFFAVWKKK
jgi:hypothetical protein